MKVAVQCPDCGKSYRIEDESLGARAQCKNCGRTFVISLDETVSLSAQRPASAEQVEPAVHERRRLPKKVGHYVLRRKLGAGAMGEVYLAHDPDLDREVAIKILPETFSSDEDRLKRFLREARLAARLHHTNAVTVYQVGAEGGLAYIAMEYVEGMTLNVTVAKQGPLDWRKATQVIRDAAAGLSAAHKIGVFHRDVKPGNLMLSSDGTTKVVDFGLARAQQVDSQLTQQGTLLGTPAYMAPEQWIGNEVDARSDLYALACTYFYLLSGQAPFDAPTLIALGYQHRHEPLPDPRDLAANIPDEVCRILLRGAAKDTVERFQTADELIAELDILLGCPDSMLSFGALWSDFGGLFDGGPESTDASFNDDIFDMGTPTTEMFPATGAYAPPTPKPTSPLSRRSVPQWVWIASSGVAAVVVLSLLLLAAVITFSTKYGQVQIVLNDDVEDIEIRIDGETISIEGLDEPLEFKIGEHDLVASSPSFETVTRTFQVKQNDVTVVDVSFTPKAIPAEPPIEKVAVTPKPTEPKPTEPKPTEPEPTKPVTPTPSPPQEPVVATSPAQPSPPNSMTPEQEITLELGGRITLQLVLIPAGSFQRGESEVRITKPFYLGKYEVSQEQWEAVMGSNPSRFKGPKNPVDSVSWSDSLAFLDKLREKYPNVAGEFRLPSEAEWEYACRARTTTSYYFGDDAADLEQYAWYDGNAGGRTHPVGEKKPNAWGLYDMHGNLWEWCRDSFDENYYQRSPVDDPPGPSSPSSVKVLRGGCWLGYDGLCQSDMRGRAVDAPDNDNGFRVAISAGDVETSAVPMADEVATTSNSPAPKKAVDVPGKSTAKPGANPNDASESSWAYLIRRPVNGIVTTPPEATIQGHGVPLTTAQIGAVSRKDSRFLSEGTYHLFRFPSKGTSRIQWTGYGTGNAQISLRCWDGSRFILQDNRDTRTNKTCTILINVMDRRGRRLGNTTDTIVNLPSTEQFIYVMVNCTSGTVYTDAISND